MKSFWSVFPLPLSSSGKYHIAEHTFSSFQIMQLHTKKRASYQFVYRSIVLSKQINASGLFVIFFVVEIECASQQCFALQCYCARSPGKFYRRRRLAYSYLVWLIILKRLISRSILNKIRQIRILNLVTIVKNEVSTKILETLNSIKTFSGPKIWLYTPEWQTISLKKPIGKKSTTNNSYKKYAIFTTHWLRKSRNFL